MGASNAGTSPRPIEAAVAARWLAAGVAVLAAGVSAAGLWGRGLYADPIELETMFRAYDLVTLVLAAPLLALTLLPGWRDRAAALLVRVSVLVYCVYIYAYYLFGAELNAALLAHVAVFTASLYALILTLVAVDVRALATGFLPRTPARVVAAILVLLGGSLAALQVAALAGFALTGAVPQEPSHLVVPPAVTRLGAVVDLSLLVPLYLLAGVWAWRRRPWGYLLATAALVSGMLHQAGYIAGMGFQVAADIPGAAFDPFEPFIVGLYAIGAGLLLGNVRGARRGTPPRPSGPRPREALSARGLGRPAGYDPSRRAR
jgi:hypothetical protein